jgi:hypothetical protein
VSPSLPATAIGASTLTARKGKLLSAASEEKLRFLA